MGNAEITGASFEDKRRAFRATAELIVADATRRVEKTLQNLQRTDLPLPDDKVRAGIVEKVIDDFVGKPEEKKPKKSKSKSMGYEDLTRMAYRRLAEELLRTGIKNYSVKLEIGPFEYFVQHYRPLFTAFGLGKGSVQWVDASLYTQAKKKGKIRDLII